MKTGKSLVELATEIERQSKAKVDYIADTRKLEMVAFTKPDTAPRYAGVDLVMENGTTHTMKVGPLAHDQIATRLQIPSRYYQRMLSESPELLASNVNHWFQEQPEKRMVRTLDGTARAFLSNRYQRIDNVHVAEVVLPVLSGTPGIEVVSAEVTDRRLYIKAVTHAVRAKVESRRVGDFVEAGVMISNSEVGLGAIQVMPFFHFLVCTNGMVRNKEGMRSAHIGTKIDGDEHLAAILADDTKLVMDRAVLMKVRDVVRAAMDADRFMEAIRLMEATTKQMVTGDPAKAIELLADDFSITDGERSGILRHLIEGGDLSRYGVMNAVTRTAEDLPDYDRATEFEMIGGRILDLPQGAWSRIAQAA